MSGTYLRFACVAAALGGLAVGLPIRAADDSSGGLPPLPHIPAPAPTTRPGGTTELPPVPSNIPWANDPVPQWVGQVNALTYDGAVTYSNPAAGGVSFPLRVTVQVRDRTPNTLNATITSEIAIPGSAPTRSEMDRTYSNAQYDGLWIPPQGMQNLRPNQELDRDNPNAESARVGQVTPQVVTIIKSKPGHQSTFIFDRKTGVLLGWEDVDRDLGQTMRAKLTNWK